MPSQLERASTLTTSPAYRRFCYWGPGGSGKSTAMCMHPGPGFVIDANCKLNEMENLDKATRERITLWQPDAPLIAEDINVTTVDLKRKDPKEGAAKTWTAEPKGYTQIMQVTNDLIRLAYMCEKEKKPFPYKWIGHDAFTDTIAHIEYSVMFRHGVNMLTQTLYDVVKRDIRAYLEGWQRLAMVAKVDTLMIAHSRPLWQRNEDGSMSLQKYEPIITGQFRDTFFNGFTEVYFFQGGSSDGKWRVQTFTDSRVTARTSRPKLERIQVVDATAFYG